MKNYQKKKLLPLLFVPAFLFSFTTATAYTNVPKTVAIFLYQGVELLDFAGPGEVFSSSGFSVYTMSFDGKEIKSQGFVTVKPQYSLETAPYPDIVVFPGGGSEPTSKNEQVIRWIKTNAEKGTFYMSVCTGAAILARSGMLEGVNVTTFHGYIDNLQQMLPNSKVLRDTRYVDNGHFITTAGVSAGMDGALHLVARIKGTDVANETAYYMEYQNWTPGKGRVDRENEYIAELRSGLTKNGTTLKIGSPVDDKVPYEGEYKNLASEFRDKKQYDLAAYVLEDALRVYPNSTGATTELGNMYRKLGKPAPIAEDELLKMLNEGKTDEAWDAYRKSQEAFQGWKIFDEEKVNMIGYHFMGDEKYDEAIRIFQFNVKAVPSSWNAWDSLAEGYMKSGKKKEAIANYKKSLELNPANDNAKEMLVKLNADSGNSKSLD